ncbi:MAG TPA: hypothetical protein VMS17_19870 [Gemmataceae bacterium]|nr:hypothetical protein [Gemmataceae bacterium]
MTEKPRNRIKGHRRIRAGDLVPHELNPRLHSESQRAALAALYEEVGFARSLLAYELPDGRLKLIDGHLRQSMDPDMEVDVEILDVDDAEARALLLSIDPLARLADYDGGKLDELRRVTDSDSDALANLWSTIAAAGAEVEKTLTRARRADAEPPEQFLVLVECADESQQAALLQRFQAEGLKCRALLS